jgi:GTP-binding protein
MKKKRFGKNGEDLVIKVPVGTMVIDEATGKIMMDMTEDGQSFVAAKGGRGGRGNARFATPTRQAPNFAEAGGFAKERQVILEMKLIADVGLVGFPNVGKSSLLSVATSARPKIANYHFTTIDPNLGVVNIYDNSFVMADIAGIIEGAHEGAGLGHYFLKHIERTKVLVHIVDVSGSEGRDPKEDFDKTNAELAQYSEKLMRKPQIVVANKIDILGCTDPEDLEICDEYIEFKNYAEGKGYKVMPMSAAAGYGVKEVIEEAYKQLLIVEENPPEEEELEFFDFELDDVDEDYRKVFAEYDGKNYIITGRQLEKIFNSTNFNDAGSRRYLFKYIENSGVYEELKEMGIEEGDTIQLFDMEFEYYDEDYDYEF